MTDLNFDPQAALGQGFTEIKLQPRCWWLRLKLSAPTSHHDPAQNDRSNKNLFRRQTKILPMENAQTSSPLSQTDVNNITRTNPVPRDIAPILKQASLEQFLAAAVLKHFIDLYNSREGEGLFSGPERYRYLEERFQHAAIMATSLLEMWGIASKNLMVSTVPVKQNEKLLRLLALPSFLASRILKTLATIPRPCVMLAQSWHEHTKLQSARYAAAANEETTAGEQEFLFYDLKGLDHGGDELIVDIPVVSSNALRHEMVREPSMWHLYHHLGLKFDETSPATTAMFYNGGDIQAGSKEPGGVFWKRKTVRETFPSLSLLSGCTDSFILGEGSLALHSWIRCRENNDVLKNVGLASQTSVFELMDEWTLTRHANRVQNSPMPFAFESLLEGAEIIVRVSLSPYASDLETGALMCALKTFEDFDSTIGGQAARGFGLVKMDYHQGEPDETNACLYDAYLAENKNHLRQSLLEQTLGTDGKIIA